VQDVPYSFAVPLFFNAVTLPILVKHMHKSFFTVMVVALGSAVLCSVMRILAQDLPMEYRWAVMLLSCVPLGFNTSLYCVAIV